MKINSVEIRAKIEIVTEEDRPHKNFLAKASLTFWSEDNYLYAIPGFGVWKSQHEGLNVTMPRSGQYQSFLPDKGFKKKIKKFILEEYNKASIPIVE